MKVFLKMAKILAAAIIFIYLVFRGVDCVLFAQPSAEEALSQQERTRQLQEKEKALRQRIEEKKQTPQIKPEFPTPQLPREAIERIFIQDIKVIDATLISEKEIKDAIEVFKNKELTIKDMQKVSDHITDLYRQKGFITSRAYLAPQKIENGVLEIKVIEGKMGSVEVKGNRYFKTKFLLDKITLKKGQVFNYNVLRKDLVKINRSPDRLSRAVLLPGKEPGQTDMVLEVKDRLPVHVGIDWDTFGSRYIEKQRYSIRFTHNNLLGLDDNLTFQYQLAQDSRFFLKSIRYILPLKSDWQIGAFGSLSRVKLGKEFEDSDVRGKAHIYGIFANKSLVDTETFNLNINFGFDYKDVVNYQFQRASSEDRLRISKLGIDSDLTDNLGRTLFFYEFDFGIPDIMGGLKKHSSSATGSGSGGRFVKNTINLLRLQKMPFSSSILWKNYIQISTYNLTSTEQFQIGGLANVRGYPPAEVVGDNGYASTFEWEFPVPFSKTKCRVAIFYDWANAHLRSPLADGKKDKTLRSAGAGIRFNLPEDFTFRLDFGWPLDNTPSDGRHLHTWAQVSKIF